jgi:hypothetical protein
LHGVVDDVQGFSDFVGGLADAQEVVDAAKDDGEVEGAFGVLVFGGFFFEVFFFGGER